MRTVRVILLALALSACKTPTSGSGLRAADEPAPTFTALQAPTIESAGQYEAMSEAAIGIIKAGRAMKFLVDNRDPQSPKVHFVNANYAEGGATPDFAKYHYFFAQKALGIPEELQEFNDNTYFTENKRYLAGVLHTYLVNEKLVYGVQFYPQDVIHGAAAVAATKLIAAQVKIPGAQFAFVETGNQQDSAALEAELNAAGFARLTLEKILGSVNYIAMNNGEAFGYLRIFPQNQDDIAATDIVVFDELPLDLTVVAGTITKAFQDTNSHVNLKSKERNTPNAVLRNAGLTHPDLAPFKDKPVHIVISNDSFRIESTTDAVIASKLKERFARPWIPIVWEKTDEILSYDAMCPTDPKGCLDLARRYGSKAAMLGFLANKMVLGRKAQAGTFSQKLGYDLVPFGFGLPLKLYRDLVDFPANAGLKEKVDSLIEKEKANKLSSGERSKLAAEIREGFYKAKFPPAALAQVKARLAAELPGIEKVKVRSSANAEDIEGFDGAGLHDSYSAKPDSTDKPDESCKREEEDDGEGGGETKAKMKPRTIACAIKGVYASLWNKRAIEERSFSRIDHATISMGISVLPAYDYQSPVAANAVVVTRVINSNDVFGYTLSIQKDNNLVTNPNPGTYSEVDVAALGLGTEPTTLTITRFAKPTKESPQLTKPVLEKGLTLQMVDVSRAVEMAYCRAKPGYYNDDCKYVTVDAAKPKSLDMEMKILANGQIVCKQAREFSGK